MKLPFFQFYPMDWLRDTRSLSPETKGAWIDILAIAWNELERGIYKRWPDMMMRELGILERDQLEKILAELDGVATIIYDTCGDPDCTTASGIPNASSHECNGEITVTSRRMVKLEKAYKINAKRQRKHYYKHKPNAQPNENLMDKTSDVRRHKRLTANVRATRAGYANAPPSATRETSKPDQEELENQEANKAWKQNTNKSLPESERMTPEEMREIRIKNLGR